MIKVSILGATGYTGHELVKILAGHPGAELIDLSAKLEAPVMIEDEFPDLAGRISMSCGPPEMGRIIQKSDVAFLALPHTVSMKCASQLLDGGVKVIDLSADFRLKSKDVYREWYGVDHEKPKLIDQAVYGLPEVNRAMLAGSTLVAKPGCYPTAAILALAPLMGQGVVDESRIIIDAKSGVTGAGRKAALALLFAECNESVRAYRVGTHQHTPEIDQELSLLAGGKIGVIFAPTLVPTNRGILCSCYLKLEKSISGKAALDIYHRFYSEAPFVRVLKEEEWPDTKHVTNTNYCDIGIGLIREKRELVVVAAIDNLVKGAAGQAVQNMNIMCGYDEREGLI